MIQDIVMISGKQGSGKDTLALDLADHLVYKSNLDCATRHVKFADVLYQMHDAVRDISMKYGIPLKQPKDGPLLQVLGTEWGRNNISQDIWCRTLKNLMYDEQILIEQLTLHKFAFFIVSDCRFKNEFNYFPNALTVRLRCPEIVRKDRCEMWRDNTEHPSETDLDEYESLGKFDLVFNTEKQSVEHCTKTIVSVLEERHK